MIGEVLIGTAFAVMCGSFIFPEQTDKIKGAAVKAAKLTSKQMSASAYTQNRTLVKGYRSQEEARRNRTRLKPSTVIYLPNGTNITVEEGMHDIESEGFWYAWTTI